jgi:hypothetical protein
MPVMRYALLVYDAPSSWHDLPTERRHARHGEYHALADLPGVIAHYRLQPPQTVRVEDNHVVRTEGPQAETRERLRALYLVESDDHDSVLELAARIPAARAGGAVEVWPLTEQ